jgi:transposase
MRITEEVFTMTTATIGLDLGKRSFHLYGVDEYGRNSLRKRLRRAELGAFFATLPRCLVGIEACPSAHFWARELAKYGHTVKAMAPRFVKPYVKSNKNDWNDAEAICEAVSRPNMRFVELKTIEQQSILHLHRTRSLLVQQRTGLINHVHALFGEYGLVLTRGASRLGRQAHAALELAADQMPGVVIAALQALVEQLEQIQEKIAELDRAILQWHRSNEASRRLTTIPGIGPLTATAIIGAVGNARMFKSGRDMAAYLGLVPRQHSTGGKPLLLGISKRGDKYLRTLLVHGARALAWALRRQQRAGRQTSHPWLTALLARKHHNTAIVAQAHKSARIAWALLTKGGEFEHRLPTAAA